MNLRSLLSHDFRHTAFNQLWRLVSGPVLLLFIPFYLSAEAQGYWYTFVSLAALAVFADMGFSAILMLFSSHEFAHLRFSAENTLVGEKRHIERLATLWAFALKWSGLMAFLVFPLVLVIGFYLLSGKDLVVDWVWPWIIYGVASVLVFINSMVLSFVEGCDSVGNIQKIRLKIGVVNVGSTLLLLMAGTSLYALAFSLLLAAITGSALVLKNYRHLFVQLSYVVDDAAYNWFREIMPLMWRYSISWISGYFILSMFAPVAFHYYSPIDAGKVGLSVAVCVAIFGVANVWIVMITPKINMLAARKDYLSLNRMFFNYLSLAALTYLVGMLALYVVVVFLRDHIPIAGRLVSSDALVTLALGWFFQLLINALAIYMRAHKEEPLVLVSFLSGIYVAGTTLLIATYLPVKYFFSGFLSAYFWIIPWVVLMFMKYKRGEV